ncbi:type IV pilus biogenesis protein PilP [Photorhabdus australis]|uniref:type IV pilus biogenesis protein PilP n=1 Tax=Photorhabdus australis TaxID=286156 RepID=UPI0006920F65|nr:type IV pilus biogenesis protein PilP [Photorhabdus australis]
MQNSKYLSLIVVLISSTCLPAKASTTGNETTQEAKPPVMTNYTLHQLEQIQAETVILEAQAARARAQKELAENVSENVTTTMPSITGSEIHSSVMPRIQQLPHIQEIYGTGNRLIARLGLPDGSWVEATTGQLIPGTEYKIKTITALEVRVSNGSNERSLPFN